MITIPITKSTPLPSPTFHRNHAFSKEENIEDAVSGDTVFASFNLLALTSCVWEHFKDLKKVITFLNYNKAKAISAKL